MKKYRIGNTITVNWAINNQDGSAYNLIKSNISLFARTHNRQWEIPSDDFSIAGNVISWVFRGEDQKILGPYTLTLVEREAGVVQVTIDQCDVFELVPCSCLSGGEDIPDISSSVLELESSWTAVQVALSEEALAYIEKQLTYKSPMNLSVLYPTDGIDGTNRYDKSMAIAKMVSAVPVDNRAVGMTCSYIDNATNAPVTMMFIGDLNAFNVDGNWREIPGKKLETGGEIFNSASSAGSNGHAEGMGTQAGYAAHAEGSNTVASGGSSHAEGIGTLAQNQAEHAQGMYNRSNTGSADADKTIHSVGIGTSGVGRKNAVEVMLNGDVYIKGVGGYNGMNATTSWVKPVNAEKKRRTGLVIGRAIPLRPVPGMLYYTDCIKISHRDFNTLDEIDISSLLGISACVIPMGMNGQFMPMRNIDSPLTIDDFNEGNVMAFYIYINIPGLDVKIYEIGDYDGEYITADALQEKPVEKLSDTHRLIPVSPNRGLCVNTYGHILTYISKPCISMNPQYHGGAMQTFYASGYLNRKSHRVFYLRSNIRHRLYPKVTQPGKAHSLFRNLKPRMVRTNPYSTTRQYSLGKDGLLQYYGVEGTRENARKHAGRPIKIHVYKRWHNKFFKFIELEGSSARMNIL